MKHLLGLLALSLFTSIVLAAERPAENLQALPDPSVYADDICWVAPEWRDEG